jgi:hypothetical protein
MNTQTHVSRILLYEGLGFLVLIALSWVDLLTGLPELVARQHIVPEWRESALQTLIVLIVGIPVMVLTKRLVSRLYYLEGFLRVCAWCKKLDYNGEWIPLAEFFERKFQTETSHAICAPCKEEMNPKSSVPHRG